MISYKKYEKWYSDHDNDDTFLLIAVNYDPESKEKYIQQKGFDLECPISDIEKYSDILTNVISKFAGNSFHVKLQYEEFSWYPDWLYKEYKETEYLKKYLETVKLKNNFEGEFEISNIKEFLINFLDYPSKYRYQDIEIFSVESDFAFVISGHGTFWFVHENEGVLKEIGKLLDNEGVTVMPLKYLT